MAGLFTERIPSALPRQLLIEVIKNMALSDQTLLHLRFIEGLSLPEMVAVLKRPHRDVEKRLDQVTTSVEIILKAKVRMRHRNRRMNKENIR